MKESSSRAKKEIDDKNGNKERKKGKDNLKGLDF